MSNPKIIYFKSKNPLSTRNMIRAKLAAQNELISNKKKLVASEVSEKNKSKETCASTSKANNSYRKLIDNSQDIFQTVENSNYINEGTRTPPNYICDKNYPLIVQENNIEMRKCSNRSLLDKFNAGIISSDSGSSDALTKSLYSKKIWVSQFSGNNLVAKEVIRNDNTNIFNPSDNFLSNQIEKQKKRRKRKRKGKRLDKYNNEEVIEPNILSNYPLSSDNLRGSIRFSDSNDIIEVVNLSQKNGGESLHEKEKTLLISENSLIQKSLRSSFIIPEASTDICEANSLDKSIVPDTQCTVGEETQELFWNDGYKNNLNQAQKHVDNNCILSSNISDESIKRVMLSPQSASANLNEQQTQSCDDISVINLSSEPSSKESSDLSINKNALSIDEINSSFESFSTAIETVSSSDSQSVDEVVDLSLVSSDPLSEKINCPEPIVYDNSSSDQSSITASHSIVTELHKEKIDLARSSKRKFYQLGDTDSSPSTSKKTKL